MPAAPLLLSAVAVFPVGRRCYARYPAGRAYAFDPGRTAPARPREDRVGFVPASRCLVSSHGSAPVAGAAPTSAPADTASGAARAPSPSPEGPAAPSRGTEPKEK